MSALRIVYTHTDEAPALATHSLLPIIEAFSLPAGVSYELQVDPSARRTHLGQLCRLPDPTATATRLAGPAGKVGYHTGGQHHQASQYQRLKYRN